MKRSPRVFVSFAATFALASCCGAAEPSSVLPSPVSPAEAASNPLLAPHPPPAPQPQYPRSVSTATARHLADVAPKFASAEDQIHAESPAAHESAEDHPQNTIVRLPSYIVQGERVPDFKRREMLTREGKVGLTEKRDPGLRLGSVSLLNDQVATGMLDEEDALERKHEMAELYALAATGNPAADAQLRKYLEEMFLRTSTWTDTGGSFQQQRR